MPNETLIDRAARSNHESLELLNAEIMRCDHLPTRIRLAEIRKRILACRGHLLMAGAESLAQVSA